MPKEDTQFKPGNPGGPGGRRLSEAEKIIRKEAPENMAIWYRELYVMSITQIKQLIGVKKGGEFVPGDEPIGKINIAKCLLKGNVHELEKLHVRILGRPPMADEILYEGPESDAARKEHERLIWERLDAHQKHERAEA